MLRALPPCMASYTAPVYIYYALCWTSCRITCFVVFSMSLIAPVCMSFTILTNFCSYYIYWELTWWYLSSFMQVEQGKSENKHWLIWGAVCANLDVTFLSSVLCSLILTKITFPYEEGAVLWIRTIGEAATKANTWWGENTEGTLHHTLWFQFPFPSSR